MIEPFSIVRTKLSGHHQCLPARKQTDKPTDRPHSVEMNIKKKAFEANQTGIAYIWVTEKDQKIL